MTKKLSLALMIGAILSANNAFGLGIGDIKVNSALNQRLKAEIELISSVEGELDDVSVKLASLYVFEKFKLNRPYFLTGIQFKVTTRADGTPIVKLTTKESIREPFLDFLVEVNWPKGHMLREYTILLDPPVTMAVRPSTPAPAEAPMIKETTPAEVIITPAEPMVSEPVIEEDTATVDTGRVDELGFPIYGDEPAAGTMVSYSGDNYGPIAADETLWSIATKVRPESVSNQQMILALFEANPDAFVNGDIHQVKRGAVLRIPDEASMLSRDQSAALAEVRQINASLPDAGEYTAEGTTEQPGISERAAEIAGTEPATTPAVDESKLSLVTPDDAISARAATSSAQIKKLKRELSLATETMTSQRMENQELRSRVNELEGTVTEIEKLKRLLELQNQEMAQLQQQLAQADQPTAVEQPAPQPVEPTIVAAPEAVTPTDTGTGTDVTTVAVDEAEVALQEPVQPAPQPVKKDPMQIAMDYVDKVKNNPTLLGTVAGVILVLLALIILVIKRKGRTEEVATEEVAAATDSAITVEKASIFAVIKDKLSSLTSKKDKAEAEEEVPDLDEMFDEIEAAVETEIGETPEAMPESMEATSEDQTILEAPVDAGAAEAVAEMDFEEASGPLEALAEEEAPAEPTGPDPLEEVDVYEAFGDFEQAAEIVKQALTDDPDNNDFKLRLFKVYNSGGMADDFSTAAVQYEAAMTGSSQWDQIVEMGKAIAPDCPVWGDSQSSPALPASEAGDMAKTMAMDVSAARGVSEAEAQPEDSGDLGMDFDLGGDVEATSSEPAVEAADETPDQPDNVMEFEGMGETAVLDVEPFAPEPEASTASIADTGEMEFESAEAPVAEEAGDTGLEFSLDDTAAIEPEAGATEEAPSEPADEGLEFDLSGFDTGDALEEPTAATEAAADEGGLEFELDDDSISAAAEPVSETVQVNIKPEELEASATTMEAPSEDPTVLFGEEEAESSDDDDAVDVSMGIDLSDFDFDMDESGTSDAIITAEEKQTETGSDDADVLAFDMEETPADEQPSEELSLDMEEGSEDPTVFLADDSDASAGSLSDDGDEVSTKLDLARAYIDMGDADGAKGILDEVVAEGNDAQKAEAESLLQKV